MEHFKSIEDVLLANADEIAKIIECASIPQKKLKRWLKQADMLKVLLIMIGIYLKL